MLSSIIMEVQALICMIHGCMLSASRFVHHAHLRFLSDPANGATTPNDTVTLEYMQKTFNDHYNGNRQPIGVYTHPLHLAVCILSYESYKGTKKSF